MKILIVVRVVHDSHLDGHALLLGLQVDDIIEEVGAMAVDVADKLLEALLGMEHLLACLARLGIRMLIRQGDLHAGIEVGQLPHTTCDDFPLESRCGEDSAVGPKLLSRTVLVRLSNDLHGIQRLALLIFLLVDIAVTKDLRHHVRGERIHTTHTHTMQTARHLVRALVELTARMEDSHNHLQRAFVELLVFIDRDSTTVILHDNRSIRTDRHLDVAAIARHGLVDGVVHRLVDEMMETLLADVADIHGWTLAHSFQTFKDLYVTGRIILFGSLNIFHVASFSFIDRKGTKKHANTEIFNRQIPRFRPPRQLGTKLFPTLSLFTHTKTRTIETQKGIHRTSYRYAMDAFVGAIDL